MTHHTGSCCCTSAPVPWRLAEGERTQLLLDPEPRTLRIHNAGPGTVFIAVPDADPRPLTAGSTAIVEGTDVMLDGSIEGAPAAGLFWEAHAANADGDVDTPSTTPAGDDDPATSNRPALETYTRAITKEIVTAIAQLYDDNRDRWLVAAATGTVRAIPLLLEPGTCAAELGLEESDLSSDLTFPYISTENLLPVPAYMTLNAFGHPYQVTWKASADEFQYEVWSQTGDADAAGDVPTIRQSVTIR